MQFLIEKSLLTRDEEFKFDRMSPKAKDKFIKNLIINHPNRDNLKNAAHLYFLSLSEDGFDDVENPFIKFMDKVNQKIDYHTLTLIKYFIDEDMLDPDVDWLYSKSLYNESEEDNEFKLKALVYATNPQKHASRQVTTDELIDEKGNIYPAAKIDELLSKITVSDEFDVIDAITRIYKNKINLKNDDAVKKLLIDIATKDGFNRKELNRLNKTDVDVLKSLAIPSRDKSDKGIAQALRGYLNDDPEVIGKTTQSAINKAKEAEQKTKEAKQKARAAKREKAKEDKFIASNILKNYINKNSLTWDDLKNFIIDNYKGSYKGLIPNELEDENFEKHKSALRKILNSKIKPVLDDEPIDILISDIKDYFDKELIK